MRKRTVESRGQERYQGKEGRKRRGKERERGWEEEWGRAAPE